MGEPRILRRGVAAAVALLVCATLAVPAGAQSQRDVDEARAELSAAADQLAAATARLQADLEHRDLLSASLVDTLAALEQANDMLAAASFDAVAAREHLDHLQGELSDMRATADHAIVGAYMRVAGTPVAPVLNATPHHASILGGLVDESIDDALDAIARVAERREGVATARADYEARSVDLRAMQRELAATSTTLEAALGDAGSDVLAALDGVAAADAAHLAAQTNLDEAQSKLAALGGVAHWMPLIERYFPPDRIAEAAAVMRCESSGRPDAVNPTSDASGLFQFKSATWAWASVGAGFGESSRFDHEANIASAAWLVDYSIRTGHPGGAWGHWECQPPVADPIGEPVTADGDGTTS